MLRSIDWQLYLPYLAGVATLMIGIARLRKELAAARDIDKLLLLGPVFLAVPMAVFGAQHFAFSEEVASMVPAWVPWHLFWTVFVGACLIGGAFALVLGTYSRLAAALFGLMLFLFEFFLHIPKIMQTPSDRFAWAVAFRDLAFAAGAVCYATFQPSKARQNLRFVVLAVARMILGITVVFFATQHFLHPEFAPGVPLQKLTPSWFPARGPLAWLTGLILLISGLCLLCNRKQKLAATSLGVWLLLLVFLLYLPIVVAKPTAIGTGLNYLADTLLLCGSVLCFAKTQPETPVAQPTET